MMRPLFRQARHLAGGALRRLYHSDQLVIYMREASAIRREAEAVALVEDCREHLALVEARDGWSAGVLRALYERRLAEGWHCVTIASRRLEHLAWWLDAETVQRAGTDDRLPLDPTYPIRLAPGTAYLGDGYTDPSARGRGHHLQSLRYRSQLAARNPDLRAVASAVLRRNDSSRRNIERLGFALVGRITRREMLGLTSIRSR